MGRTLASLNVVIGGSIEGLQRELRKAESVLNRTARSFENIGRSFSTYVTLPIAALGATAVKSYADTERLTKGLEAMMGSAAAAGAEIEKLREIAKLPGINFEQAVEGALRLQSIGLSADEARGALAAFANALALAGKSSEELSGVTLALSQIVSKGKVMAQEINQLAERIPYIRKILLDAFGTGEGDQITKILEANGKDVKDFVSIVTAELNKLPKVQSGLANSFENFASAIKQALAGIGEEINKAFDLQGLVEKFSDKLSQLVNWFKSLDDQSKRNIITFTAVAAAIGPITLIVGKLISSIGTIIGALRLVVSPAGAVVAIIAALGAAAIYVYGNWQAFKDRFNNIWATIYNFIAVTINKILGEINDFVKAATFGTVDLGLEKFTIQFKELIAETTPFKGFGETVKDVTSEVFNSFFKVEKSAKNLGDGVKALNNDLTVLNKNLTDAGSKGEDLSKKFQGIAQEIGRTAAPGQVESQTLDLSGAQGLGLKTDPLGLGTKLDSLRNSANQAADSVFQAFTPLGQVFTDIFQGAEGKLGELGKGLAQFGDIFATAFTGILDIFTAGLEKRKQELDNYYQRERAAIEKSSLTEEQKQAKLLALEEKVAKEKRKIARKEAAANKAKAIFEATINGAAAVVKALANPVLAAVIGALAAAQIAVIAATPLPALAKGGIAYGDSIVRVGEYPNARVNPEVIAPLSDLRALLGGVGGGELSVRLSGDDLLFVLERAQSKQFRRAGR